MPQLLKPTRKPTDRHEAKRHPSSLPAAGITINGTMHIPSWVMDHKSFRRWLNLNDFPESGEFFYLNGELWVDLSMETMIHNQIKSVIMIVVGSLILKEALGRYVTDRMMLTHVAAGLSCEPDGMFISNQTFASDLVTLEKGGDSLEIIGTPDMTLEVVSKTSFAKDMVFLKELYAKAGIAEYWLVDSTSEKPELIIYYLSDGKYVTVRRHNGWVKSKVFGRSFRLTCSMDANDMSSFDLEVK